jgi:hypothetical protein
MKFTTTTPLQLTLILGLLVCQNLTAQTYCPSKGNLPWTEWIASVKIGTINNASNKEGYGDFTSQTTNLTQGTSYPLSITQGFSYAPDPANAGQQGRVWIDYNKNGTFEATELVASFTRTTITANVLIPTTALTGATRMRVSFKTIGAPTACEVFDKGEVEDYTVNIQGGTTQSCANNALNFDGINDQVISSRTVIPANADFTMEASFISTATTTGCGGAFRRLLVFDLGSSLNRFEIGDCAGQLTLYYYFGNVDELVNIPNATTLRNGNWHHVSVVKQGTNLMIYYDGVLVLTRPNMGGVNPVARQLIVGSWVQPIENWEGSIDEVKVWNYAMTASEVQSKRLCQPTGTESNLLLYYPFNQGASSGDNTAITTVLDKSLSANNGLMRNFTLTGATSNFVCSTLPVAPCVTSCANNALNFDGVNDLLISTRATIPANADFTLEASFISTATSTGCVGAFRRLLVFDLGSSLNRFEIGDCAGQLTSFIDIPGNSNDLTNIPGTSTLRNGNWHHVSVVKQGNNLTIYYDGVSVLTRANMGALNPVARQLIVGSWVQPIENWQGSIDEVKVWNYAMTAAEVQSKRLCQPTGTESNLLLYYPFNQGVSGRDNSAITTVLDKSLSANNGILRNFVLTGSTSNFVCSTLGVAPCVVVNNSCRYQDSLQLVSLYNATDGAHWVNTWELNMPINTWYGVSLNANGCVSEIRMDNNYLNGIVPNLNLPNLQTLALPNNPITSNIPNFNLPNLTRLDFFNCKLLGTIPNFNLPKLQFLILNLNKFTGTIPNFNYPNLQTIALSGNQLTGTIPNFNLPKLQILFLSDNQLSGAIPNLVAPLLTSFLVANNQLTGCLPAFLKNMCTIYTTVDISGNPSLATQDFAAFCTNNTGACTTTATNDLALSITSTPSVYRIYTTHNFKVSVVNSGTTAFTNVKIKFTRPLLTNSGGSKVASIGTFQDYCPGSVECSEWTIPSLAAGATATLDAPVFILAPTGGITATATLLSSTPTDNIVANNTAAITINPATAPAQAPANQALAFRVPTQLIPVIIQRISPNPTEGDVQIKLDSWTKQTVDFNFSDITGKIIYSEKRDLEKGLNRLDFDVYHLPQGVYFIQTNVGKGRDVPTKFVKM